jgi:hypothetical protein
MRQAAVRTLLVVSERPHPWAFLRDRLDPDLVSVAWARPAEAGACAAPWMLAGTGLDAPDGLSALRGRLLGWRWVGPAPPGLPAPPLLCPDWHGVAASAERALAVTLAGLRLAPACGLVLPDGSYLAGAAGLEALLAAHPDGLEVGVSTPHLRRVVRRTAGLLQRHRLPLRLAWAGTRLALVETGSPSPPEGEGRGGGRTAPDNGQVGASRTCTRGRCAEVATPAGPAVTAASRVIPPTLTLPLRGGGNTGEA